MTVPRQVLEGGDRHGVARHARDLATAVGARVGQDVAAAAPLTARGPLHLHFTDRLWGGSPEDAARRIERMAARVPLTVTLHDLPQPSDGPGNLARRRDCYGRVVRAARGVVCTSTHEAALLESTLQAGHGVVPAVIPLPVQRRGGPAAPAGDDVALLGFFYPGKGHREVVQAVAGLAGPREVVALGGPSPGHEAELARLVADAERSRVRLTVTGFLEEDELLERCRRAAVPVAAHQHVSASASITTWIAAGRRPLVPDSRYGRELAALRPGTVALYAPGELGLAVEAARRDLGSTVLPEGTPTGPDLDDVAGRYLAWWSDVVAW